MQNWAALRASIVLDLCQPIGSKMEAVNFSAKFYNTVMTCIARAVQIISLQQRMNDGLLTYNVASPTIH